MRLPLVAAVAAAAALSTPAAATGPGAGAVALSGTSFFRPQNGVAVVGLCTYTGTVLAGVAVGITVPPGNNTGTTIVCDLWDSAGPIDSVNGTGGVAAEAAEAYLPGGRTPTRICGRAIAGTSTWSHPAESAYTCAPILPGPLT